MELKNVIFDFGGIIVDLDKQAVIDAFGRLGFDVRPHVGRYVQSGVFAALETGRMSAEEFCDEVRRTSGHAMSDEEICRAWNCMLTGIPVRRLQFVRSLRPRFHTYMLSNTNPIHWDYSCHVLLADAGLRMEGCFERIFLSYQLHLAKPDPAIFGTVLAEAGLRPEEALFVDDSAENCRIAAASGLQVFHSCCPEDWMDFIGKEMLK